VPRELTSDLITSSWWPDDVRVSPDGTHVAWTAQPYGKEGEHPERAIWVTPIDGDESPARWTRGGSDSRARWSPDSRRIAFHSDRAERGTVGLYVIDLAGGEARPVVVRKRSVGPFAWSPDNRTLAFLAPDEPDDSDKRREDERDDADVYGERWKHHRLLRVDHDSGQVTPLYCPDHHLTDVAWSPDGRTLAVVAQPTPEAEAAEAASLWLVDDAGDEPRQVCTAPRITDPCWVDHGSSLVYVAPHERERQSAWTAWRVAAAPDADPVVVGPHRTEPRCALGVRNARDEHRVVILVAEGLDTRLEWCDPGTGAREVLWEADGDVTSYDMASGPVLAAATYASRGPLEVWAGAPRLLHQRSDHHAGFSDVRLGSVEDFLFTSVDGLPLDGVLIHPPGSSAAPVPMVVLVHGGPYGRSGREWHCAPLDWGQWLAAAGYAVLMPNYRGGVGHGNDFAVAVRGDMGGADWRDIMAAVDTAVERGIADPDRLGIGGWSQGGYLTGWAVTHTDRFKAAVMGAGVSDWGMMSLTSDLPTFESVLAGDVPWHGPGPHRADERSPMSYATCRRTPLLLLHGQEDERVPVSQAIGFHRALRDQDVPVELVTYPREPHGISERRHQQDILRRVRDWFDRWLLER